MSRNTGASETPPATVQCVWQAQLIAFSRSIVCSIEKHPEVQFWVIVNPGSGPGPSALPDANYLREIPKLQSYSNVVILGYVHVSFTTRNLADVLDDIATYSRWHSDSNRPGLLVHGIFVDETPNHYDVHAEKFLRDISEYTKTCRGLGMGSKIIHNPGSIPPAAYMQYADVTVIFEDSLQVFRSRLAQKHFDQLQLPTSGTRITPDPQKKERFAVMIHSIPNDLDTRAMKDIVTNAKSVAGHLFFTDLEAQFYESFSPRWHEWVKQIASSAPSI